MTVGDDAKLRFYDQRNSTAPLREISQPHSHWIWSVEYNPFYDQLLLTGGSDFQLGLHHVASLSSATLHHQQQQHRSDDETDPSLKAKANKQGNVPKVHQQDSVLRVLDCHEESIYGVSWSRADPWVFASISYDGRVIINSVPNEEKFKIIL